MDLFWYCNTFYDKYIINSVYTYFKLGNSLKLPEKLFSFYFAKKRVCCYITYNKTLQEPTYVSTTSVKYACNIFETHVHLCFGIRNMFARIKNERLGSAPSTFRKILNTRKRALCANKTSTIRSLINTVFAVWGR